MERRSVLDEKPSRVFGFPLTIKQQLWLIFFLPTACLLSVYILDVATDVSVALLFVSERRYLPALVTVVIVYIPPLLTYLGRLSDPPDTKRMRVVLAWFSLETAAFFLFPIRILQCIGERLFWSIEALRLEDPEREGALEEYENTRCHLIENYLFTQAYLQAGPQAVIQAIFLADRISSDLHTEIVEGACVLTSIATLALVTSWYERYERQVGAGRYQVWSPVEQELMKVMDEDNPIGRLCSFIFWFFFILGRILSLVIAAIFFPWIVIGVAVGHAVLSFVYLSFSPPTHITSIPLKFFLSIIFVFCIVEVHVQFRKTKIFYILYYSLIVVENACLTILWVTLSKWSGTFYYASIYIIVIAHVLAFIFLIVYNKFLKPDVTRIEIIVATQEISFSNSLEISDAILI